MVDHTRSGTQKEARANEATMAMAASTMESTVPTAEAAVGAKSAAVAGAAAAKRAACLPESKCWNITYTQRCCCVFISLSLFLCGFQQYYVATIMRRRRRRRRRSCRYRHRQRHRRRLQQCRVAWQRVTCSWLAVSILWAWAFGRMVARKWSAHVSELNHIAWAANVPCLPSF